MEYSLTNILHVLSAVRLHNTNQLRFLAVLGVREDTYLASLQRFGHNFNFPGRPRSELVRYLEDLGSSLSTYSDFGLYLTLVNCSCAQFYN